MPPKYSAPSSKRLYHPPLFDRLNQHGPDLLTAEEVKDSVKNEVSLMLNTRCTVLQHNQQDVYALPELFGLFDFSSFQGEDTAQWPHLAHHLEHCVRAFDPRIKEPVIKILNFNPTLQKISCTLSGFITFGEKVESITFPLSVFLKEENE